jgi:hypothetical protein
MSSNSFELHSDWKAAEIKRLEDEVNIILARLDRSIANAYPLNPRNIELPITRAEAVALAEFFALVERNQKEQLYARGLQYKGAKLVVV